MTDRELLEQILATMQGMQHDITDLKSDVDILKSDVTDIRTKVETIDSKVDRNYNTTLEFYGYQREVNTDTTDRLEVIEGKLEMHDNQIARNTSDIRRIK